MDKITITEALAKIPTIVKRIEKKQEFVTMYLYRQSAIRDPHEKDGGSAVLIAHEMQSIKDLQDLTVSIRAAIQKANSENTITIGQDTRSIVDWLTWRREIAPSHQKFLKDISNRLNSMRQQAMQKGFGVSDKDAGFSNDFIVSINEKDLSDEIEGMEEILGTLDGQLSLKNATIQIEI